MNERQLILVKLIIDEILANSKMNSEKNCFEQFPALNLQMELAEYKELQSIKTYLDDLLEDIPAVAH